MEGGAAPSSMAALAFLISGPHMAGIRPVRLLAGPALTLPVTSELAINPVMSRAPVCSRWLRSCGGDTVGPDRSQDDGSRSGAIAVLDQPPEATTTLSIHEETPLVQ